MLNYLSINNVRLFQNNKANFTLSPLSVFCGTNSCGKSTILKTLLLIRQSQGLFETYGTRPGTLRFTGAQVDLGNYRSFVTNNDTQKNIEIAVGFLLPMPSFIYRDICKMNNMSVPRNQKSMKFDLRSSFVFSASQSSGEYDSPNEMKSTSLDGILSYSKWELSVNGTQLLSWEIKPGRTNQAGRRRYQVIIPVHNIPDSDLALRELIKSPQQDSVSVDVDLDGLILSRSIGIARAMSSQETSRKFLTVRDIPDVIPYSMQMFVRALRQIHYIAPLRAPAKRYYLTNFDITADLDPTGDFLPYFLGGIIEEPIVVDVPPKFVTPIRHSLSEALNGWLYYLRTGSMYYKPKLGEFEASTHKSALVEISLKGIKGSSVHSLADSGFGFSQVLPILVRGLLAKKDSTIIVEQPELHLNPSLQVRLADFFISMIHAGKQVIIETHSEHIVNAIRVLTANSDSSRINDAIRIYFIDIEHNRPVIHDFNIQKDGTIPKWPKKFFGEAANLATELLRAQKKLRERKV